MQHARVGIYKVKSGTADEVIRRATDDLIRTYHTQRSFVAHGIIKTGDDGLIFLSV